LTAGYGNGLSNLYLIIRRVLTVRPSDRLTGLTKYSLLAAPRPHTPVSPAEHSAPLGRRVCGDEVLIQRSTPLQRRASQQSQATYDPISITPAAGRAARRGATLQHVDSVGIGRPMICACWRDIDESML